MPNRILKESICTSETIDKLSAEEERFFYRLIVQCDDFGRLDARPQILRAKCFPLKTDSLTNEDIQRWLKALVEVGLIVLYEVDGRPYLQVITWAKHQRTRAKESKYPDPSKGRVISLNSDGTCCQMTADDRNCQQMRPYTNTESESNSNTYSYIDSAVVVMNSTETKETVEGIRDITPQQPPPPPIETPPKRHFLAVQLEREFGRPLSPLEHEVFADMLVNYPEEFVQEALRRAVAAGKLNLRYMRGILSAWKRQGLKTLREVLDFERKREESKEVCTGGKARGNTGSFARASPTAEDYLSSYKNW